MRVIQAFRKKHTLIAVVLTLVPIAAQATAVVRR